MRLSESILRYLKEDYKVGVDKNKIMSAIEEVYKRYCEISEKYFDKETIQNIYKIINDPDIDTNLAGLLDKQVRTDEDGTPLEVYAQTVETTKNGNEYYIYMYFPVLQRNGMEPDEPVDLELYPTFSFGKDKNADIRKTNGTSAMGRYFNIYGYGYVNYTDVQDFPYGDDDLNIDIALDFLDKKNKFLSDYKRECLVTQGIIKRAIESRAAEKKKDIANKQREVAKVFNKDIE